MGWDVSDPRHKRAEEVLRSHNPKLDLEGVALLPISCQLADQELIKS